MPDSATLTFFHPSVVHTRSIFSAPNAQTPPSDLGGIAATAGRYFRGLFLPTGIVI